MRESALLAALAAAAVLWAGGARAQLAAEIDCRLCDWQSPLFVPGSLKWCRCCASDCDGFRNDCLRDGAFCAHCGRCAALQLCAPFRDPTLELACVSADEPVAPPPPPPPMPTPPPTPFPVA